MLQTGRFDRLTGPWPEGDWLFPGRKNMQAPLQIAIHGLDASNELEKHIREKAEKLEAFFNRITSCHVVVDTPHKHHHQGRQYRVSIKLRVPGEELAVNHNHDEDVYVALRDAFDAARRKLEDYARIRRGDVKQHEPKPSRMAD